MKTKAAETFPDLKRRRFWGAGLWSKGYYAGTTGAVSAKTIQKYIENQKLVLSICERYRTPHIYRAYIPGLKDAWFYAQRYKNRHYSAKAKIVAVLFFPIN